MDVRPGYKRTEVEVIPQEWVITSLADCCKKITDGTHDTPRPVKKGVPFLTAIHVKDNRIAYDECLFVSNADHEIIFKRCNPEKGDVLLVNIGAGVATTALVEVDYEFSLKNVALLKPDSARVLGIYLSYCLAKKKEGITQALLSGGAQPFLSLTQIGQIRIPVPPLPEQCAIAEALSDTDAHIESLEQLLTKKRQIKKGAMQELLTGKKRLLGFSGEWETTTLGEIADIRNGATPSTQITAYWNGSIPWCTPSDITSAPGKYLITTERSITGEGLTSCAASLLPAGALLLCSRATIGDIKIAVSLVCTNQGFKSLVCKKGVSNQFLYYLLVTLKPQMIERASGSTFLEIGKRDVAAIEVRLPPYSEQTAIATILSDMDAEITALEAKLSKTRQIKQGMMQELLTGRIRLI